MKTFAKNFTVVLTLLALLTGFAMGQIISQYIETNSGTAPKGIEIWNNTVGELNFSSNPLVIEKSANGAVPAVDYTLSSGTLAVGAVIVIGTNAAPSLQTVTEANGATFYYEGFTFNGDDGLIVRYGGTITDVFGDPGTGDPAGSGWLGNGVQTYNQNIQIKDGITTGDTDGWTDPSTRFEVVSADPVNDQSGFGIAPGSTDPLITLSTTSLTSFTYVVGNGPSTEQSFTAEGSNLSANITLTSPTNYEISTTSDAGGTFTATDPITLSQTGGTVATTTIYVRLKAGLSVGSYDNEDITAASTDADNKTVTCSGSVAAPLPNAWINEIHYDNGDVADANEGVEVIIENVSSYVLSNFSIILYNGSDGGNEGLHALDGFTEGDTDGNFTIYYKMIAGIQNGAPDGIALSYNSNVIQFLSYEGSFTATDGDASGETSTDIIVSESSSTTSTQSLQLTGTGTQYSDFTWVADLAQTWGTNNNAGDQALPITLASFTATAVNGTVELAWETATETNNARFVIYRNDVAIASVDGAGTISEPHNYSYVDAAVVPGVAYTYILADVDLGNNETRYEDIAVTVTLANDLVEADFVVGAAYPNPFNPKTVISMHYAVGSNTVINIYNTQGVLVDQLINGFVEAGYHELTWNASGMPSGVYIVKMQAGEFVNSQKIVLMK